MTNLELNRSVVLTIVALDCRFCFEILILFQIVFIFHHYITASVLHNCLHSLVFSFLVFKQISFSSDGLTESGLVLTSKQHCLFEN